MLHIVPTSRHAIEDLIYSLVKVNVQKKLVFWLPIEVVVIFVYIYIYIYTYIYIHVCVIVGSDEPNMSYEVPLPCVYSATPAEKVGSTISPLLICTLSSRQFT